MLVSLGIQYLRPCTLHFLPRVSRHLPLPLCPFPKLAPSDQSTLITTLQPSAPASLIAQARHPLLRLDTTAFHPFSAHTALTRTSISEPNCRRRVSWCIFFPAVSKPGVVPTGVTGGASDDRLLVRETVGESGISCSWGRGVKLVMQSMTRTLADWFVAGVREGRCAVEG